MTNIKVCHIERKRNIPPNYRSNRCHCEARSAAAIRWSKVRGIYSVDLHPPGRLLRYARKDNKTACHRERKRGDPRE